LLLGPILAVSSLCIPCLFEVFVEPFENMARCLEFYDLFALQGVDDAENVAANQSLGLLQVAGQIKDIIWADLPVTVDVVQHEPQLLLLSYITRYELIQMTPMLLKCVHCWKFHNLQD
jgi:hypothetical protein